MKGTDFKRWATRGCRIYGEDPWFFIRELAQNARDAGADRVEISTWWTERGHEVFRFTDDGTGMSSDHARQFLFRLYASSKDDERDAAGEYGIGFWAVLRYNPIRIRVDSRTDEEGWAIELDEQFNISESRCKLDQTGTRVTLLRNATSDCEEDFRDAARRAVGRYCRYLRQNDRQHSVLPVLYRGQHVNEKMTLKGPVSLSFRQGAVEGVAGLAPKPSVELFARGLPVWKGLLLDELSYDSSRLSWRGEIVQGLSPVYLLNGNHLNVVMSRNAVIDDKALADVRRVAARAQQRLVDTYLNRSFPAGFWRRRWRAIRAAGRRLGRLPAWIAVAIPAILVVGFVATWLGPDLLSTVQETAGVREAQSDYDSKPGISDHFLHTILAPPTLPDAAQIIPTVYRGSLVDTPPILRRIYLHYTPPVPLRFRIMIATRFNPKRGFVARWEDAKPHFFPGFQCEDDCISVTLQVKRSGATPLPLPTGYRIQAHSVTINNIPVDELLAPEDGSPAINVESSDSTVRYLCGPVTDPGPSAVPGTPPAMDSMPLEVVQKLELSRTQSASEKAATAVRLVRQLLQYDDSEAAAEIYTKLDDADDWLGFVLASGRGDCDVMNALAILFLWQMDVPSRLAIGVVGRKGKAMSGLHAWTEYHDGQFWQAIDASEGRIERRGGAKGEGAKPEGARREGAKQEGAKQEDVKEEGAKQEGAKQEDERREGAKQEGAKQEDERREGAKQEDERREGAKQEDERRGDEGIETGRQVAVMAAVGLSIAVLALLLFLAYRRRPLKGEQIQDNDSDDKAREVLGKMALAAITQPNTWHQADAIWSHPVLPLINGRSLSLARAVRLAAQGRLAVANSRHNTLSKQSEGAGSLVLDGADNAFGRVGYHLAGIVNLDHVWRLQPIFSDSDDSLIGRANRILRIAGTRIPLVLCPGLTDRSFLDVDLWAVKLAADGYPFPSRFVAVSPDREAGGLAQLSGQYPDLAAFRLVDKVLSSSRFFRADEERMRYRVATSVMEEQ
jgi:hypothetical protein